MGYYTDYSLVIKNTKDKIDYNLIEEVVEAFDLPLEDDGQSYDSCKWYDHEQDIKGISEKYPDNLFILEGIGEESEDIWKLYVKNGKSIRYRVRLVFDEFKEEDLI